MARWQVTLQDPHSPSIPDVVLECFGSDGYRRNILRWSQLEGFTSNNTPLISGPRGGYRFLWNFAVQMDEPMALRLAAMARKQRLREDANLDGHLILVDEFEYTIPESTAIKSYLSGSELSVSYGGVSYSHGFPRLKVKLALPEDCWEHLGTANGDEYWKLFKFTATEVGNVA